MIFSTKLSKRLKQTKFIINYKQLQTVDEYTYLWLKISFTGNFTESQLQTKEKTLHAFYNLTGCVDLKRLITKNANKLYEKNGCSNCICGSEILGAYTKLSFESWEESPVEKVHLLFCKYYFGVNNRATNIACRAELGRFPLKLLINFQILKYFVQMV